MQNNISTLYFIIEIDNYVVKSVQVSFIFCSFVIFVQKISSQNKSYRSPTSWFFLRFSNDFGVTVIRHQNADAMVQPVRVWEAFTLLIIFKMADVQGGMPLKRALARTMRSAFWWWIMAWQRLLESTIDILYTLYTRYNLVPRVFNTEDPGMVWSRASPTFSAQGGVGKVSNYMLPMGYYKKINFANY
jgi:hypothetical protein